jgi:hypothetical protein
MVDSNMAGAGGEVSGVFSNGCKESMRLLPSMILPVSISSHIPQFTLSIKQP